MIVLLNHHFEYVNSDDDTYIYAGRGPVRIDITLINQEQGYHVQVWWTQRKEEGSIEIALICDDVKEAKDIWQAFWFAMDKLKTLKHKAWSALL